MKSEETNISFGKKGTLTRGWVPGLVDSIGTLDLPLSLAAMAKLYAKPRKWTLWQFYQFIEKNWHGFIAKRVVLATGQLHVSSSIP
jgi:hypothetical protein